MSEGLGPVQTFGDHSATRIDGAVQSMRDYLGQVVLVVNVASRCGYTPQYAGLETLYRRFRGRGFTVLGFPCNQFGAQEPASEAEIARFCSTSYDITFPMFAVVDVNGDGAHPLWAWLKTSQPGILGTERIKWNFTKFLVDRSGTVVKRYGSSTTPDEVAADIEALLSRRTAPPR